MRFGNTEQGQGVDKGVEALIDGPGYRKRRTICILVCLDIQKRDWGRWEVEAERDGKRAQRKRRSQGLAVQLQSIIGENHEADWDTGRSLLGEPGVPLRDLVTRLIASSVNTGRVCCGGLVAPATPGGEE